jgi:uncharacterized C2H2 Zn-finger protein
MERDSQSDEDQDEDEDEQVIVKCTQIQFCPKCGQKMKPSSKREHLEQCLGKGAFKIKRAGEKKEGGAVDNKAVAFICSKCPKVFRSRVNYDKHRFFCDDGVTLAQFEANADAEDDPRTKSKKASATTKVKPKNFCEMCKKTFSSSQYLEQHKIIHRGEKPHVCPDCPAAFADRTSLRNHARGHSGDRPFRCPHCPDKAFRRSDNLKYHLSSHQTERSFMCARCAKSFRTQKDLKSHEKTVHVEVGGGVAFGVLLKSKFDCQDCVETFPSNNALKYHRRMRHSPSGRSFPCSHCPRVCISSSALETHSRVHSGIKPHACAHCPKTFGRLSHARMHEARHALVSAASEAFNCSICNKSFVEKEELSLHERMDHNETTANIVTFRLDGDEDQATTTTFVFSDGLNTMEDGLSAVEENDDADENIVRAVTIEMV